MIGAPSVCSHMSGSSALSSFDSEGVSIVLEFSCPSASEGSSISRYENAVKATRITVATANKAVPLVDIV